MTVTIGIPIRHSHLKTILAALLLSSSSSVSSSSLAMQLIVSVAKDKSNLGSCTLRMVCIISSASSEPAKSLLKMKSCDCIGTNMLDLVMTLFSAS